MQTEIMKVAGMTCGGCVNSVTKALRAIVGVADVQVALATGEVTVQFDEQRTGLTQLQLAVQDAGYGVDARQGCHGGRQGKGGCCC